MTRQPNQENVGPGLISELESHPNHSWNLALPSSRIPVSSIIMNLSADEYTRRSIDVASDHEIPSPHFILCNLLQFAFSKKHNDARTSADKLIKIPGIIDELTKAYKETSFAAVQKLG